MYTHSASQSKEKRIGGRQRTVTQDLYLKVRGEVGTKCTDTRDLYLKVRGAVGTQCTHTQEHYLKVRGEAGHSVHTFRTSI